MNERIITPDKYEQSIFGTPRERGYGASNVHDVFRKTATPDLIDFIAKFYGSRCAHIPDNTKHTGVIVEERTPRIVEHYENYVSDVLQTPLHVDDIASLNGIHRGALVVPFINTTYVEQQFRVRGLDVWGLPGIVVDTLKNKADCHKLIDTLAIDGFTTPDHRIVEIDQLEKSANKYLQDIQIQYQRTGMNDYQVGLMLRSPEGDGGYGGCFIKQEANGYYTLTKNGSSDEKEIFKTEKEVLHAAQLFLKDTGNGKPEVESRVVISRLMDLADSPGISAIVSDGEITTLPWNGQVQEQDSTACSGTSSYMPNTEYLRTIMMSEEAKTSDAFKRFISTTMTQFNIDNSRVRGVVNADLMVPGPKEIEFQKRLGKAAGITIAEINPRFTNWTDALLFVIGVNGEVKSINNILRTIEQGVLTQDKFHFPKGTDMSYARHCIREIDKKLMPDKTRVLVRMIDEDKATMGLVYSGDIAKARKELDNLASRI